MSHQRTITYKSILKPGTRETYILKEGESVAPNGLRCLADNTPLVKRHKGEYACPNCKFEYLLPERRAGPRREDLVNYSRELEARSTDELLQRASSLVPLEARRLIELRAGIRNNL